MRASHLIHTVNEFQAQAKALGFKIQLNLHDGPISLIRDDPDNEVSFKTIEQAEIYLDGFKAGIEAKP